MINSAMPKVSVIIPCYNSELYLQECINSVIKQTYKNIEIILIDDGSSDSTLKICYEYSEKNNNIKVVHQENGGLSCARNTGLKNASGSYVTFVDSDDIIYSNMIEDMIYLAIKENAEIVKFGIKRIYNDQPVESSFPNGKYNVISSIEALELIYDSNVRIISSCGKLFSINLFKNLKFPEGLFYEDEYTTPKLFDIANRIVMSDKDFYFYMQRDNDSIMRGRLTDKKIYDSLFVEKERIEFFESKKYSHLVRLAKIDYYYKMQNLLDAAQNEGLEQVVEKISDLISNYRRKEFCIVSLVDAKQKLYGIYKKIIK